MWQLLSGPTVVHLTTDYYWLLLLLLLWGCSVLWRHCTKVMDAGDCPMVVWWHSFDKLGFSFDQKCAYLTCIKYRIRNISFHIFHQTMEEHVCYFWLMTYSQLHQWQVRELQKRNLIIPTQQAAGAVTQEPFISSHLQLFISHNKSISCHGETLNNSLSFSFCPFPSSSSLVFPPVPTFNTSSPSDSLFPHPSLMYYFHLTALYLSSSSALLPRCRPTCLPWNVRSAFISLDHPSAPHAAKQYLCSPPASLCGHPMHPLFCSSAPHLGDPFAPLPPAPISDNKLCPSTDDEVCILLRPGA